MTNLSPLRLAYIKREEKREAELALYRLDLEKYIESFLLFRQVKSNTRKTYKSQLINFLTSCPNPTNASNIHRWIERQKENYTPLTIRSMVDVVKSFLRYLDEHDIEHNKAYNRVIYKYEYRGGNHERIPDHKFLKMVEDCDVSTLTGLRDLALLRLYQSTGMRINEPLGCKLGDIQVLKEYSTDGNYTPMNIPILKFTQKGGYEAYTALFPKTYEAIRAYIDSRTDVKDKNAPLFRSHSNRTKDGWMNSDNVSAIFRQRFNAVGLVGREYTVHSFRYTQAMKVLEETGSEALASQQLRHLSPKTIQYYVQEIRALNNAKTMLNLEI